MVASSTLYFNFNFLLFSVHSSDLFFHYRSFKANMSKKFPVVGFLFLFLVTGKLGKRK